MTYGEEQINQMFEQVADYAGDWPECIEMVEEIPLDAPDLHEYLCLLTTRLSKMRRELNRVVYDDHIYKVLNYTYKMYEYLRWNYGEKAVITPSWIAVHTDDLTPKDRDAFQKQLMHSI